MSQSAKSNPASRCQIVYWPGEGLVAEVNSDFGRQYYTLQGLQWYVLDMQRRGVAAPIEEAALHKLSQAYDSPHPLDSLLQL